MALGKPAVLTPKTLDLRAVQGTINSIRERLQLIEQAVVSFGAPSASSQASSIATLQFQVAQLASRLASVEAQVGVTDVINLVASDAVAAGDPVVPTGPGTCGPADLTDPAAIYAVIGLAQTAAALGQTVPVQRRGQFSLTGVAFDVGRAVYVNVGGLTQYPSYTDLALPVGVAVSATQVWVRPGWPALRVLGFDSGYEDFLPASVGLVRPTIEAVEIIEAGNRVVYAAVDTTLLEGDRLCVVDASLGDLDITLPPSSVAGFDKTMVITVHRQDDVGPSGPDPVVEIRPQSGETVGGLSSYPLLNGASVTVLASAIGWVVA